MKNEIKIVIGSWGSYNECNERALGSSWLTLNDYNDWDEILEELKKQGFALNGTDEELFVQDIENFPADGENWDYVNPQELFETLKKSGVLDDEEKYELMDAFCSIEGYREWERLVDKYEDRWDDDIYLWRNYDWYDLGYELLHEGNSIPEYRTAFSMKGSAGATFQRSAMPLRSATASSICWNISARTMKK